MSGLIAIAFTDEDGGLSKLLKDSKLPDPAIRWITGSDPTSLGVEGMTDFINSFTSTGFETEIENRVTEAAIDGAEE